MEDALISPMGFMILSGAGLLEASEENKIKVHKTKVSNDIDIVDGNMAITLNDKPYFVLKDGQDFDNTILEPNKIYDLDNSGKNNFIYVMSLENGEVNSEPYIPMSIKQNYKTGEAINLSALKEDMSVTKQQTKEIDEGANIDIFNSTLSASLSDGTVSCGIIIKYKGLIKIKASSPGAGGNFLEIDGTSKGEYNSGIAEYSGYVNETIYFYLTAGVIEVELNNLIPDSYQLILNPDDDIDMLNDTVLVDYYVSKGQGVQQINITPDKFGGNFYLEASTLFRETNGSDMPAEFVIPNCKIQSNFNFTMASSGDPSTFTFTMDAFPDYTRFDSTKKVLASIQIIEDNEKDENDFRASTKA